MLSGCWPIHTQFGFSLPSPADAKMAATDQPKKSTKIVWRTCISCTTRLSELCYDTHTLCEACRGKVCNSTSFCKECENWTADFRKLYLRHKRTLLLKRVSKKDKKGGRAKTKSPPQVDDGPPQVDDAASTASQESHVSPPVVLLPLNQELMDANIGLEELQTFQHVDNVVELQLQPVVPPPPPPPPPPPVSVDTSFFDKVNNMMETFNKFVPFLSELGSARRSPTAGSSDIVSPNPVDRVPDTAPQGPDVAPQSPDVAPGSSSASMEPRASGSGLHLHRDDKFTTPRGQLDKGDQHSGIRHASQLPSPSHHDRLREQLEDVHRQLSHTREIVDFYRAHGRVPPDQSQDDLENLQAKYAQISIALEESLYVASSHRRGPSPAFSSHRVVSPPDAAPLGPHSSSLHGSRRSDRPRSPSHDRRAQETPSAVTLASVAVRMNATWNGSFLATLLPTEEGPVLGNRFLPDIWTFQASHLRLTRSSSLHRGHLRHHGNDSLQEGHPLQNECDSLLMHHTRSDSPHGGHLRLLRSDSPHGGHLRLLRSDSPHGGHLRLLRSDSPHGGHLRLLRSDSPPRGHPHLSEWDSLRTQGLAHPGDPFLGIFALQGHAPPGIPSLQREVPLLNEDVTSREIQSLLSSITHLELRLGSLLKRGPIHGLLLPILLLL